MENFIYSKFTYTYNSISIEDFNLSIGDKSLFIDSNLSLSNNNIYCLIGKNGFGKTTLLKQLNKICDSDKIRILYVEQELILDERTPIEYILDSNVKMKMYQDKVKQLEEFDYSTEIYAELEYYNSLLQSYNIDKEISIVKRILIGLGFNAKTMEHKSSSFSGGWQMRISLARSLYLEPDLLLLDEPTNHLDLEAIEWLSEYLSSWKKIAVIVSHNIGFINNVCSHVLNIDDKKIVTYKGNYYMFKKSYNNKLNEMKKDYDKYDKKLKEFKKKGKTKNELDEFIKKNYVMRPEKDYNVIIQFDTVSKVSSNIISFNNVSFCYDNNEIIKDVTFGLSMESKVALLGPNGCGKSTLIKLILNHLKPNTGEILVKDNIQIGYYSQHFEQHLPFDKTPVDVLLEYNNNIEYVRSLLGKIKLESSAHNKLIGELSGGQKAKTAICKLILEQPDFLLLDEPTNHLDIETVEALIEGLRNYTGGLLLITHESELINQLDTEIWRINNKKILT